MRNNTKKNNKSCQAGSYAVPNELMTKLTALSSINGDELKEDLLNLLEAAMMSEYADDWDNYQRGHAVFMVRHLPVLVECVTEIVKPYSKMQRSGTIQKHFGFSLKK
jgi:hypothetical protein